MKIGLVGTGGVGGFVAAFLAQGVHQVVALARGAHLQAIATKGLRLDGELAQLTVTNLQVAERGQALGACDLVFVAVKTFDLDDCMPDLRAMVADHTVVVPLLNGITSADLLAERLGAARVIPGIIYVNSWVEAPGVIKQVGQLAKIVLGEAAGGVSERLHRLSDVITSAGIACELEQDVTRRNWEKFLGFEPMAVIGALSRSTIGTFRAHAQTRELLLSLMEEVARIGRAKGVALPADAVTKRMVIVDGLAEGATISMQRDLMAGRRSEFIEQSVGLLALAKSLGVPTPAHDHYIPLLLLQEQAARAAQGKVS
ncbi:MAG: 2-dehydropantoate 2-reductase [Myxococcales bacterium]|nr:2-dehydropantoate 2-reductase [Myxococcales bacterium]